MTYFTAGPSPADFAPEPRYSEEEFRNAQDHAYANDPEVLEACLDYHVGALKGQSLIDRLDYLWARAADEAHSMLVEQLADRGAA